MSTMFSSTASILRRLNDAFTSACLDENLKCSVNCCIVRLSTTNSTTMTEQDKITIFDALIKPFLCSDSSMDGPDGNNLFTPAIRQLLNSSLLAQRDKHLECERYERIPTRNAQWNGFKARTIRTSTGQITLDVPQVRNSQTPFITGSCDEHEIPQYRGCAYSKCIQRWEPSICQADDSTCLI